MQILIFYLKRQKGLLAQSTRTRRGKSNLLAPGSVDLSACDR